jgi:cytochrome c peroxidase
MKRTFSSRISQILVLLFFITLTAATIDLDNLFDYEGQITPVYITRDNQSMENSISNEGATLGRVLFYDKNLSLNNTISCGSCHKQEFAFSDTAVRSVGFEGGLTGRHSMRLINARFADEMRFFWDKRAESLEVQTTMPVQDHVEMGFSGTGGQPGIDSLLNRLSSISYYQQLFTLVYGDSEITEARVQKAIAQFVRSIQSYDSKYDIGKSIAIVDAEPFPNFTAEENLGKELFRLTPIDGGAGCAACHRPPEFDIDFQSQNNGVISVAGDPSEIDLFNTRSPTLRDLVNPQGLLNGPMMHNGEFSSLEQVIEHYNLIPPNPLNTNLDPRFQGPGANLGLTNEEKAALVAFLRTLSGNDVYTNERWSDPFEEDGSITIIPGTANLIAKESLRFTMYPNPASDFLQIRGVQGNYRLSAFTITGMKVASLAFSEKVKLDVRNWEKGTYLIILEDAFGKVHKQTFLKN